MPKRNIMLALNTTPNGGSPQNGFDLAAFDDLHQKGGMFNVVSIRETVPNAFYRVGVDGFTRTHLCNTANFSHMKENYYFIHVPYGLISRNAYQMLVDRKQPYTALDMGIEKFPTFSLEAVLHRLIEIAQFDVTQSQYSKYRDVHGFNIAFGACRLLDMLGYGYYTDIIEATKTVQGFTTTIAKRIITSLVSGKRPNANALAAYQCCWYHFFRNDIYDNDVSARCFNFDDVTYSVDGSTFNYDILTTRSVNDFIIECCQLRYIPYKKDIFTGAMPGTQFGPVSSVSIDIDLSEASASLEGLSGTFTGNQITPTGSFTGTNATIAPGRVTSGLDLKTTDAGVYDLTGNSNPITGTDRSRWFHGAMDSDDMQVYFNDSDSVQPDSASVGDGDSVSTSRTSATGHTHVIGNHKHQIQPVSYTPQGSIQINTITPTGTVNLSSSSAYISGLTGTSLFDVLKLVEAQAIQKWRQKSMMAGNKTSDQFRAHHGVVPKHLIDHMPDFIGSVDNIISVTEITSQADTASAEDESNLGEIRGRGYGASNNRTFDFHSDDYGLLLVLHAIVPENVYCSFGIDQMHTKTVYTDFYQNEYQNIGLQFVPKYLLAPSSTGDNPSNPSQTGGSSFQAGGFGFAPRYFDYKQRISKVHGLFNTTRIVGTGVYRPLDIFGYADMQSFVMTRRDLVQSISVDDNGQVTLGDYGMQLSNLYVDPRIFDSIFARAADDFQDSDVFFSHVRVICDASEPMSVLGLPQF